MADLGFVDQKLKSLPTALQPALKDIFREVLRQMRIGHPSGTAPDPTLNMAGAFLHTTTPAVAGTEFSIAHGFGVKPYLAIPVLRLDAVGSSVVSLTVSRVADDKRLYFTSTVASAPVSIWVEG
jgi:hypothetical protein